MAKYQIARELGNKEVMTVNGDKIGRMSDAQIDECTGKIIAIIVDPRKDMPTGLEFPVDEDGYIIVPYDNVHAISEMVVVRA